MPIKMPMIFVVQLPKITEMETPLLGRQQNYYRFGAEKICCSFKLLSYSGWF
jgi:hypothetical protein